MRWIDLPPVWLVGALGIVWIVGRWMPMPWFGPWGEMVGAGLVALGFGVMTVAAGQMLLRRTTVIPRQAPTALVTGGLFRLSRNPIYLADALILCGFILYWDVPLAAPVAFGFMLLIQHRFIYAEETVLRRAFGAEFDDWAARTGRWFGLRLR